VKPSRISFVILTANLIACVGACWAAEWPQYRGPNQDGISSERLNVSWGPDGPPTLWKAPMNSGFSSFAVSGGKAFTQVVRSKETESREVCVALDAATGKELWFVDIGPGTGYSGGGDGDGPRSTPTVSDGMVYLLSPALVVFGVNADTGKILWSRDLKKEHEGRNIGWNSAASVAVDGDLVFVAGGGPGQSLLGLNKKTGAVVWKAHDDTITHSTPVVATIHGQRQVIFFLKSGLLSVSPKDGKTFWHFSFPFNVSTAISPVVSGDIVYCSSGYGIGGAACRITKDGNGFTAEKLWAIPGDKLVANHWSTPVCKDGYLYGMFSFKKLKTGPLKCVELATGAIKWEKPGFGQGNVILVGEKILALADSGELVVVEATPAAYKELLRTQAVAGKCWSTPALSEGRVYVRSVSEGACLEIIKAGGTPK
jgi:outer membrane protein assembly factor BamB